MADKKISELNEIIEVQNDDMLPIVDTSEAQTSRVTKLELERSFRLSELTGTTDDLTEGTNNKFFSQTLFNSALTLVSTDNVSEGVNNLYWTQGRFDTAFSNKTTTDLTEGANLYFTSARFDARFNTKTTSDLTEGSNLYFTNARFSNRFATKTTEDLAEGPNNRYFTQGRFDSAFDQKTTTDLAEGDNLYYTDQRVNDRIESYFGGPGGILLLDNDGLIPTSLIPELAISRVFVVQTIAERDALDVQTGDVAKVLEFDAEGREKTFIYDGGQWIKLKSTDLVESVNGKTGNITLSTSDIAEGNNLYWTNTRFLDAFFQRNTDNLQEGIGNLYFTEARVVNTLNQISINELKDVNIIDPGTVPGHYLSWSGTEWVSTPPEAFSDTKDLKVTGTDIHPDFLNKKLFGTDDRIVVSVDDPLSDGNKQMFIDIGSSIIDVTEDTTDKLNEGSNNLYYTVQRFDDRLATKTTDDLAEGANLYYTDQRFDDRLATKTTDDLAEGSNLYYTDQRVDDHVDLRNINNKLVVNKNPGPSQYASITDALAVINTANNASNDNKYLIEVSPGEYFEDPFDLPPFVILKGAGRSTWLKPNNNDSDFITMHGESVLTDLELFGPTDVGYKTLSFATNGSINIYRLHDIVFTTAYALIDIDHQSNSSIRIQASNCMICRDAQIVNPFSLKTNSSSGELIFTSINFSHAIINTSINYYVDVSGSNTIVDFIGASVRVADNGFLNHAIHVEDGARVNGTGGVIVGADVTMHVANVGAPPEVQVSGLVSKALTADLLVEHPDTLGSIIVTADANKTIIPEGAPIKVIISDYTESEIGQLILGDIYQGLSPQRIINQSLLTRHSSSIGRYDGGTIVQGSTNDEFVVNAGTGFIVDQVDDFVRQVSWEESTFTLPPDTLRWVAVNRDSQVVLLEAKPSNNLNNIILGRVTFCSSNDLVIEDVSVDGVHMSNRAEEFYRDALGAIFAAGSIVTESGTPLELNVTSGRYYYGTNVYNPNGGDNIEFRYFYRDGSGGFESDNGVTAVPVKYDDDSGVLQDLSAGYYVKHLLILVGNGDNEFYNLVIGQEQFSDLTLVEQADLPILPSNFDESYVKIASIIVREGESNIVQIRDERPRVGFRASGVAASTFHGNLLGLTNDDHPQYLLVSGSRAMEGTLNMSNNNITNVNLINGVNIASHASRHLPNGADALDTATAITLSANTTNTEGNANSFARSNHTHDILTGNVSTQNAGQSNVEGTSVNLARADHRHEIPTAAAVTLSLTSTNQEGNSTSFARANHTHQLNLAFGTPSTITDSTNTEGAATSFARSDHQHAHGNRGGGSLHALATTSAAGFMSSADKTKLDNLISGGEFKFTAKDFESPINNNWFVSDPAGLINSPGNNAFILSRAFPNTGSRAVGFYLDVPSLATSVKLTMWVRRRNASAGNIATMRFHRRAINDNAAIGAWNNITLTNITNLIDDNWRKVEFNLTLADLELSAGDFFACQLSRNGGNLVSDLLIANVKFEFLN